MHATHSQLLALSELKFLCNHSLAISILSNYPSRLPVMQIAEHQFAGCYAE